MIGENFFMKSVPCGKLMLWTLNRQTTD